MLTPLNWIGLLLCEDENNVFKILKMYMRAHGISVEYKTDRFMPGPRVCEPCHKGSCFPHFGKQIVIDLCWLLRKHPNHSQTGSEAWPLEPRLLQRTQASRGELSFVGLSSRGQEHTQIHFLYFKQKGPQGLHLNPPEKDFVDVVSCLKQHTLWR